MEGFPFGRAGVVLMKQTPHKISAMPAISRGTHRSSNKIAAKTGAVG
jgi:hypothetical protein